MKILLLMDNRGDRNWGSQATTQALVRLLEERYPGAEIEGIPRSATLPTKSLRKRTEEWAPRAMQRDYRGVLDRWTMGLLTGPWGARYAAADLVVLNGEGTLHPQRQTRRWLPAIDYLQHRYRKPLWIVNTTVSCVGSPERWQFERVLRVAEKIVVRDAVSHQELQGMGIDSVPAADCAYLTEPQPMTRPTAPYAILTGTSAIRDWPLDVFRTAVEILRGEGLEVIFTASDRLDFDLPEKMGMKLQTFTDREIGPRELMDLQAGAKILVGGRYHPTILAALSGTPFVSLTSNTFKTEALMKALGSEELMLRPASADQLPKAIQKALQPEWPNRLREAAQAQIPFARQNVF